MDLIKYEFNEKLTDILLHLQYLSTHFIIYKTSISIDNEMNNNYYEFCIDEIKKICDISVYVKIQIYSNCILLKIVSSITYDADYNDILFYSTLFNPQFLNYIEFSDFIIIISKIKKTINSLQFNNLLGIFQNTSTIRTSNKLIKYFNTCKNITLNESINQCSICYELTQAKTKCKHPLCFKCFEKIEFKITHLSNCILDINCNCIASKLCPICRTTMS